MSLYTSSYPSANGKVRRLVSTRDNSVCSMEDKVEVPTFRSFTLFGSKQQESKSSISQISSCRGILIGLKTHQCVGDTDEVDSPSPKQSQKNYKSFEELSNIRVKEISDFETHNNLIDPQFWYLEADIPLEEVLNHGVSLLLKMSGKDIEYKDFKKCFLASHKKPSFAEMARYRQIESILKRPQNSSILSRALSNKQRVLGEYKDYGFSVQ